MSVSHEPTHHGKTVSPKLVGITGYAQHGKDSIGRILVEQHGFVRHAFADQLKAMALVLNPIIAAGRGAMSIIEPMRLSVFVESFGWEEAKKNPEVRRFLQVLGTEAVRDMIGENAWVDALDRVVFTHSKTDDTERVVVTDVRFPNEAEYIRRNRGIIVRVVRPNFDNGVSKEHPSEAFIESIEDDYNITNDGTLDDLLVAVTAVLLREKGHPKAKWERGVEA